MKKLLALSGMIIATAASLPMANAGEKTTSAKQGAVFTTSAVVGGAAAGPIGVILGAIGGAYMAEQVKKADAATLTELELAEKQMQLAQLQTELANADAKVGELSQLALDKLEFQVMFHTGADRLTERSQARVKALAKFLSLHPNLSVRLSGHTDPRGTDEYNNVLSDQRALSVQRALETEGIDGYRIERRGYGSDKSLALKGDYGTYAMERRVDIEIYKSDATSSLVQAH